MSRSSLDPCSSSSAPGKHRSMLKCLLSGIMSYCMYPKFVQKYSGVSRGTCKFLQVHFLQCLVALVAPFLALLTCPGAICHPYRAPRVFCAYLCYAAYYIRSFSQMPSLPTSPFSTQPSAECTVGDQYMLGEWGGGGGEGSPGKSTRAFSGILKGTQSLIEFVSFQRTIYPRSSFLDTQMAKPGRIQSYSY